MSATVIRDVIYGSVQGAGLVADIAYSEGPNLKPAIISVHGGRWIRGTRQDDGKDGRPDNGVIDLIRWSDAGYFAMRIDYRLVTCTPAPACFQDVMCAVRWVRMHSKDYGIDHHNIFLVGQSAGGHLAALAATGGGTLFEVSGGWEDVSMEFRGAISVAGPYDLLQLDWGSGWCPPGVPWDLARRQASPLHRADKYCKPILMIHAMDDRSVPIEQADAFATKLCNVGATHKYVRLNAGGHLKMTSAVEEMSRLYLQELLAASAGSLEA